MARSGHLQPERLQPPPGMENRRGGGCHHLALALFFRPGRGLPSQAALGVILLSLSLPPHFILLVSYKKKMFFSFRD